MRGVDPDEVAAQGGTRSCGRNMVRVRILRMPRIEVEIHRKAVKPLNSRDVLSRACVRTMPKAPANRPQTPFFGFSRKYHEVEKTPLEKNEKVLLEHQCLMARGRTPSDRQSFRSCPSFSVAVFTFGKSLLMRLAGVCWLERGSDYTLLGWPPSRLRSDTDQKKLGKRHRSSILVVGAFDHNVYTKYGKNM